MAIPLKSKSGFTFYLLKYSRGVKLDILRGWEGIGTRKDSVLNQDKIIVKGWLGGGLKRGKLGDGFPGWVFSDFALLVLMRNLKPLALCHKWGPRVCAPVCLWGGQLWAPSSRVAPREGPPWRGRHREHHCPEVTRGTPRWASAHGASGQRVPRTHPSSARGMWICFCSRNDHGLELWECSPQVCQVGQINMQGFQLNWKVFQIA